MVPRAQPAQQEAPAQGFHKPPTEATVLMAQTAEPLARLPQQVQTALTPRQDSPAELAPLELAVVWALTPQVLLGQVPMEVSLLTVPPMHKQPQAHKA